MALGVTLTALSSAAPALAATGARPAAQRLAPVAPQLSTQVANAGAKCAAVDADEAKPGPAADKSAGKPADSSAKPRVRESAAKAHDS